MTEKKPVVLVTGASGFVGRHLVPVLAREGWQVRRAVRTLSGGDGEVLTGSIGPVTDWRAAAGFCLHLLAIALFGWAVLATRRARPAMAFAEDRPELVFRSGPYATIRHPFYTAYLLFWLGCAIATSSLILFLVFLSLAVIYTTAALGEERNFSRSAISDEYESFRKATGFFWPKLRLARR